MTNANKNVTKKEIGLLKVICALVAIVLAISCVSSFNLLKLKAVDSAFEDGMEVEVNADVKKTLDLPAVNYVNYNSASYDVFCLNALYQGIRKGDSINIYNADTEVLSTGNTRLMEAIYKNNSPMGNNTDDYIKKWNVFDLSSEGAASAEKYLGRALYFGSQGKGAIDKFESLTEQEYYTITQDAIWQISHYGKGWEQGIYKSLQGTDIPPETCRFIHKNEETLKLMQIIFDEENYPAPKVSIAIGTYSDDSKMAWVQSFILGRIEPEIQTRVAIPALNKTAEYNSKDIIDIEAVDLDSITTIIDYVDYMGMTKDEEYKVTGSLYKYVDGPNDKLITTATKDCAAGGASGKWDIEFEIAPGMLEAGETYYISEEAVKGTKKLTHDGSDKNSQKFEVNSDPKIKTRVSVFGKTASYSDTGIITVDAADLASINKVVDFIDYEDMKSGDVYEVTGSLYEYVDGTNDKLILEAKNQSRTANGTSGEWRIEFDITSGLLEPDTTYYISERAVKVGTKTVVEHDGSAHDTQKFKVDPIPTNPRIRTRVAVLGITAEYGDTDIITIDASDLSRLDKITDYVDYDEMKVGDKYEVTGRLYKYVDGTTLNDVLITSSVPKVFEAESASGTWEVEFDIFEGMLEDDATYYISESAVKVGTNETLTHDGSDKNSQKFAIVSAPFTTNGTVTTVEKPTTSSTTDATTLQGSTITRGTKEKGPETGDTNMLMTLIAVAGVSAGALSLTVGARKHINKRK